MLVPRETLYDQVWAEPMTKVAAGYGVSSSFLARVCRRLRIPTPSRGYWAQLEVGKAPARPTLPSAQPGDEIEWSRNGDARRVPMPAPEAPTVPMKVAVKRTGRHPLLIGVEELFEKGRVSDAGYLRPNKRLLVDIFVTKECLPHALRTASELFNSLEARGHRVVLAPYNHHLARPEVDHRSVAKGYQTHTEHWTPDRPTVVLVGTVAFGLTLYEISESAEGRRVDGKYVRVPERKTPRPRDPHEWINMRDFATGRLAIRATSPYRGAEWRKVWIEENPGDLRTRFDQIAAELEAAAPSLATAVKERQRVDEIDRQRAAERYQRWLVQEEERRRQEAYEASREELLSIIESWTLARQIEDFLITAAARTESLEPDERIFVMQRLEVARQMFDGVDPLNHLARWKSPEER